jgi:hypothetical protein
MLSKRGHSRAGGNPEIKKVKKRRKNWIPAFAGMTTHVFITFFKSKMLSK